MSGTTESNLHVLVLTYLNLKNTIINTIIIIRILQMKKLMQREVKLAQSHCGKVEVQTQEVRSQTPSWGLSAMLGNVRIIRWASREADFQAYLGVCSSISYFLSGAKVSLPQVRDWVKSEVLQHLEYQNYYSGSNTDSLSLLSVTF